MSCACGMSEHFTEVELECITSLRSLGCGRDAALRALLEEAWNVRQAAARLLADPEPEPADNERFDRHPTSGVVAIGPGLCVGGCGRPVANPRCCTGCPTHHMRTCTARNKARTGKGATSSMTPGGSSSSQQGVHPPQPVPSRVAEPAAQGNQRVPEGRPGGTLAGGGQRSVTRSASASPALRRLAGNRNA